MRALPLTLVLLLGVSACASNDLYGGDLPWVRYALAASHGADPTGGRGGPSEAAFQDAVHLWTEAVADAAGCRLPAGQVSQAGLVAAVELATMAGYSRTGGGGSDLREMGRYAADMALAAASYERRPSRARCSRLSRWLPEVNDQGGAAVRAATINGLRAVIGSR
jgi:hypothetical protein